MGIQITRWTGLPHVYEPFSVNALVSVDTGSLPQPAHGIGIAIVKSIMRPNEDGSLRVSPGDDRTTLATQEFTVLGLGGVRVSSSDQGKKATCVIKFLTALKYFSDVSKP